jgi:hypothetical protein
VRREDSASEVTYPVQGPKAWIEKFKLKFACAKEASMKTFSSTYFARHRLEVLSCAREEPVGITRYGVLSFVLVSATEYERLSGVCIFPNLEYEER